MTGDRKIKEMEFFRKRKNNGVSNEMVIKLEHKENR